jgi:hypothetical protein
VALRCCGTLGEFAVGLSEALSCSVVGFVHNSAAVTQLRPNRAVNRTRRCGVQSSVSRGGGAPVTLARWASPDAERRRDERLD